MPSLLAFLVTQKVIKSFYLVMRLDLMPIYDFDFLTCIARFNASTEAVLYQDNMSSILMAKNGKLSSTKRTKEHEHLLLLCDRPDPCERPHCTALLD